MESDHVVKCWRLSLIGNYVVFIENTAVYRHAHSCTKKPCLNQENMNTFTECKFDISISL